uniref:DOMON domain-containing protein n=1 Tax=Panagrolaimus sp. PS1159 TaxID=55785 RepID=A0AC35FG63_9BILA
MNLQFIFSLAIIAFPAFAKHVDGHQHHNESQSNDQTSLLVELPNLKYNLTWHSDFENQEVIFTVIILKPKELEVSRWLMFGFSDHGKVEGSDFCLFNNNGDRNFIDGYLNDKLEAKIDVHQDCFLEDLDWKNGTIIFRRKFTTCDIRDYAVEPGTTQFLLATGLNKFKSMNDKDVSYHLRYNMLLQYPVKFPANDPDAKTMTILAKDAPVPPQRTTYWCAIVKLDENLQNRKHHVIKIEPFITKGLEQIVHHMVLFHCAAEGDAQDVFNGNCLSSDMYHMCSKTLAAWSMGASTVFYPKEAGLPFGGPGFRPLVMVEIHYNNPQLKKGLRDHSGFTLTYTPNLRPNDAGIIELGHIYSDANSIPPGQKAFPLTSYCIADCTQKLPEEGITIFGTQLHAHETGRKLWTSHFRNGVKIGEVNRDNHYTHHWQHIMALQKPVKVLPGDVLTTTCVYDTADKKEFVFGGYEINNEMCLNYIYYYPVSEIEVCKSAVDNSTLRAWFEKHGVDGGNETFIHQKYQQLESKWNQSMTDDLIELYTSSKINMACLNHTGQLFEGHKTGWEKIDVPQTFAGIFEKHRDSHECPAIND